METNQLLKLGSRVLLTGLCFGVATAAMAGPVSRSNNSVGIRAGVVVLASNHVGVGTAFDDAPFVWYAADHDYLSKPAGWYFYNPHAQSTLLAPVQARWANQSALTSNFTIGTLFSPLTKNTAPYWEVDLSTATDATITDYDVLSVSAYEYLSLSPVERAKLRKFMDQGGVLWVDTASTTSFDLANGTPISFFQATHAQPTPDTLFANPVSQLMTYPYIVGQTPVGELSPTVGANIIRVDLNAAGVPNLIPILQTVGAEFDQLETDETDSTTNLPVVMSGKVGNGAIVITTRKAALASQNGLASTYYAGTPNYLSSGDNSEFAINVVHLADGFSQAAQGSRKTSSSPIDVGAPLLQTFKDENHTGAQAFTTPVEYKGLLFTSLGNRLYAYSAKPGSDLDFNGNPDDGIQDFSLGKGYDLVWESIPLNGNISGPVAFSVPGKSNNPADEVMVVDGSGTVQAFNAFPTQANGVFGTTDVSPFASYTAPSGPSTPNTNGQVPFAPTFADGLVYVTDSIMSSVGSGSSGRLWVVDPASGSSVNQWSAGSPSNSLFREASAPATIGDIPIQDNSGGVDVVAYLPLANVSTTSAAGVVSLWQGVKGEQHPLVVDATPQIVVTTRAGQAGATIYNPGTTNAHGIRVSLSDANGFPISSATLNNDLSGTITDINGTLQIGLKPGITAATLAGQGVTTVSLDYSIDWDYNGPGIQGIVRGTIDLPDDTNDSKSILGPIALGPQGDLFFTHSNPNDTNSDGAFYVLKEYGRGAFQVLSRFDLYPAFTLNLQGGASTVNYPETLEDMDPVQGFAPAFLGGAFTKMTFVSGVTVHNNIAYVKARGYKAGIVPCTIVMAFDGNPKPATFSLSTSLSDPFEIVQPDINRSQPTDKTNPIIFSQMTSSQMTVNRVNGVTQISFPSLSSSLQNQLTQTFSESLPLILRQSGSPDQVIEPSQLGNWSTLKWYTVLHGVDDGQFGPVAFDTGNIVATGNTIFTAGNSIQAAIFSGVPPFTATPSGILTGMTATVSAGDPFLVNDPTRRPWFNQLNLLSTTGGSFQANPDILWPQANGVTSFAQYRQRLFQTTLGGSDVITPRRCYGLTAGDGKLYAVGNMGVYGYEHADFTVADSGRVATFDPSGNALWSTDSGALLSSNGGVANLVPLARPTRAYPISGQQWLVTDPSSNRVAYLNRTGTLLSTVSKMTLDPAYQPVGYLSGDPLTFSNPQDVLQFTSTETASPFTSPQPLERWVHTVVADTGHNRFVEYVDRYNVDPVSKQVTGLIAQHVLYSISPQNYSGTGFGYTALARVLSPYSNAYVLAAAVGQQTNSRSSLGLDNPVADSGTGTTAPQDHASGGNGTILLVDESAPNQTQAITQVFVPTVPAGVLLDPTTGLPNTTPIASHMMKLGSISSMTMSVVYNKVTGTSNLSVMFTNEKGVFEITPDGTVVGQWDVSWMLPNVVYETMRRDLGTGAISGTNPTQFHAAYAKRTSSGTIIIVNGFVGETLAGNPFSGEVLEIEGDPYSAATNTGFSFTSLNLGFSSLSIRFELPSIEGSRGLIAPVFADRN